MSTQATAIDCAECKARVPNNPDGTAAYHPYLFCELVKLGHHDPAAYLASYGFTREARVGQKEADQ